MGGLEEEQEGVRGFAEELDGMTVDDFGNDAARECNVSVEMSVKGETPVLKSVVGKTLGNVEGETLNLYVEGGDPV